MLHIRHRRIDWWAAGIQLIGTVWFNRTTLSALLVGLGASPAHHPIWRPDALGSICFLVSSWLAWAEECHGPFAWRPSRISWQITALNLAGSVAFGVSAIASYVTSSGQLLSVALTNLGTFVGAVCFLIGAVLLLPERTLEAPDEEPAPTAGRSRRHRATPVVVSARRRCDPHAAGGPRDPSGAWCPSPPSVGAEEQEGRRHQRQHDGAHPALAGQEEGQADEGAGGQGQLRRVADEEVPPEDGRRPGRPGPARSWCRLFGDQTPVRAAACA